MVASVRAPAAPDFYRGDCARQLDGFLADFEPSRRPTRPVAGIVPHAGWLFSGRTAAWVFRNIAERGAPETVILLGAVHVWGVRQPALFPAGAWQTPLGPVGVDEELAERVLEAGKGLVEAAPEAHESEHAIEVQVPMVRHLMPETRILPIAVPPRREALALGDVLAEVLADAPRGRAVVVGSTDLTHYGASYGFAPAGRGEAAERWMEENDRRILVLGERLDAEAILEEAATHRNACGPGAFAATVQAAKGLGATEGVVVQHTTSHRIMPRGSFETAVGYAGMLF